MCTTFTAFTAHISTRTSKHSVRPLIAYVGMSTNLKERIAAYLPYHPDDL